jgi:hypothetical protein
VAAVPSPLLARNSRLILHVSHVCEPEKWLLQAFLQSRASPPLSSSTSLTCCARMGSLTRGSLLVSVSAKLHARSAYLSRAPSLSLVRCPTLFTRSVLLFRPSRPVDAIKSQDEDLSSAYAAYTAGKVSFRQLAVIAASVGEHCAGGDDVQGGSVTSARAPTVQKAAPPPAPSDRKQPQQRSAVDSRGEQAEDSDESQAGGLASLHADIVSRLRQVCHVPIVWLS